MSLAWDGDAERVVIECFEVGEGATGEDEEDLPGRRRRRRAAPSLRVSLTGAGRPGVRQAGARGRRGRPAAVPVLRQPARPRGAHLPAGQRVPALSQPDELPGGRRRCRRPPDEAALLELLTQGEIDVNGRLVDA